LSVFALGSNLLILGAHLQVVLAEADVMHFNGRVKDVVGLLLNHVILLRAQDGARSGDSDPADEGFGLYLIMLHTVKTDEGARAAKTGFAVDGNGSCVGVGKMTLAGVQKIVNNVGRRGGPVNKNHVVVGYASLLKLSLVILRLVQPDDSRNFQMFKYLGVTRSTVAITRLLALVTINWSHKGNELARNNPVEIAILDLFVMFVLSGVELFEVVPFLFDTEF